MRWGYKNIVNIFLLVYYNILACIHSWRILPCGESSPTPAHQQEIYHFWSVKTKVSRLKACNDSSWFLWFLQRWTPSPGWHFETLWKPWSRGPREVMSKFLTHSPQLIKGYYFKLWMCANLLYSSKSSQQRTARITVCMQIKSWQFNTQVSTALYRIKWIPYASISVNVFLRSKSIEDSLWIISGF